MVHRWYEGAPTIAPHGTPVVRMLIFLPSKIFPVINIRKNSPLREYQRCNKDFFSTNKRKEN